MNREKLNCQRTRSHFQHSVYFATSLEGFQTEGQKILVDDWIHISLHELFHNYQDESVKYSPELIRMINFPVLQQIKQDHHHNDLLVSELKLLARAACGSDPRENKRDLVSAIKIRTRRWEYVRPKFSVSSKGWERYSARTEGTARYVEHKIMAMWPEYAGHTILTDDPLFRKYASYKSEVPTAWCTEIAGYSHSYWYDLGFAYSLMLDKLDPG